MGTLQEDAKPFLIPLLENRGTLLHRKAQTRLASWVVMTVMVGEFLDQNMTAITASERNWFYSNIKPPKNWRIWIGQHQSKDHPLWTHNIMALADEEVEESLLGTPAESNTHTSTILFGEHLIVHVMSSEIAWHIIRRWQLPPRIEPMMRQIWPLRTSRITWPPSERLNDAATGHMAQQFFSRVHRQLMIDGLRN